MIEGYAQAFADEEEELSEFNNKKRRGNNEIKRGI